MRAYLPFFFVFMVLTFNSCSSAREEVASEFHFGPGPDAEFHFGPGPFADWEADREPL